MTTSRWALLHLPADTPPVSGRLSRAAWEPGEGRRAGTWPCGGCQVTLGSSVQCLLQQLTCFLIQVAVSFDHEQNALSRSGLLTSSFQAARPSLLGLLVRITDSVGEQPALCQASAFVPTLQEPLAACTSGHRLLSWVPVAWRQAGPGFILSPGAVVPISVKITFLGRFMTGSARLVLRSAQDQMNRWGRWGAAPWRLGPRGVGPARPGAAVAGVTHAVLRSRALVQPWLPWNSSLLIQGLRSCWSEAPR